MIDNVVLLLGGALQKKSVRDLLGRCHPLGRFSEMEAVNIAETPSDLFHAILVETPLGTSVGVGSSRVRSLPRAPESTAQWGGCWEWGDQPSPPAQLRQGALRAPRARTRREHSSPTPRPRMCMTAVLVTPPLPRAPFLPRHRRPHGARMAVRKSAQ